MILHMYKKGTIEMTGERFYFFQFFRQYLLLHYQNTRNKKWKKLKIKYNFRQEYLEFCFSSISFPNYSFPLKKKMFCPMLCLDWLFCSLDDCGLTGCGHFGASSEPYSHTKLFLFLLPYQEVKLQHWPDIFFCL